MDPHVEAFNHASRQGWRAWAAYVDRVLDDYLEAKAARDVADLETLYRDTGGLHLDGSPNVAVLDTGEYVVTPRSAPPFDHGADWSTP
jgi:hypothetical protein